MLFNKANATTFIVTSNADSGPGTLREAMTNAGINDNVLTDYIYFNLLGTSASDFTINLTQNLPNVSSNLVIDATSQPSIFTFPNQTKVKISSPVSNNPITIFKGNSIINFEIYGLFVYDYTDEVVSRPTVGLR
ncbi:MAG: hypothetical protein EOO96_21775, partial [Pedobacter sp.]